MKNMKVSRKLLVSFIAVIVLAVIIGGIGITGMSRLNDAQDSMYVAQTEPLTYLSNLTTIMQRMRINMREYELGALKDDSAQIENAYTMTQDWLAEATENFDAFKKTIVMNEVQVLFDEARSLYDTEFKAALEESYQLAVARDIEGVDRIINASGVGSARDAINKVVDNLDQCLALKVQQASDANIAGDNLFKMEFRIILVSLFVAVLSALVLALYISGLISKPLTLLAAFMSRAGSTGDIALGDADRQVIDTFGRRKDEIGQTISAAASFVTRITEISQGLETVSNGDLTVEIAPLTERDTLGLSLQKMTGNLNTMFGDVNLSTSQVSTGASQVADGAQALAAGATQQAATVEELSSSIAEIADRTKNNATRAEEAAKLAGTIKQSAEKGSRQMDEMMDAVKDINQSSHDISKVIKVIDDIAFQTNILALNAAVEAARAGQHGKGFAVVAEEVRNLAAKSATAAKDTESMIANSLQKAELGVRIAGETSASLTEIVSGINESSMLVSEIATSSEEQSLAITQINTGIDQVAQVVQQNSATAEESAAASEEMSSQAAILQQLVAQFRIKGSGYDHELSISVGPERKRIAASVETDFVPTTSRGELGKY